MTTLAAYVKAAIDLLGEQIGRYVPATSLTTTTAVSTSLAFGGNSEQRYAQWWLWRPDTATAADRDRNVDSFAPATGTLTHSGTNYGDTTATSETLILTPPQFDPFKFRTACDRAIRQIREYDETEIPCEGQSWHWIHELDGLEDSASVRDVYWKPKPVLTRNEFFQKRHSVNTSGIFVPDYWTVSNNADTTPFEATDYRNQKWMYSITRSTANVTVVQTASTLRNGVDGDAPAGETITAYLIADPNAADDIQLALADGTTTSTTTGSGATQQEYTCSLTLADAADTLTLTITAQTNDATHKLYRAGICVGDLTDSIRRDDFPRYRLSGYDFEQSGPLKIRNPYTGRGQLIIGSERPFPGFDATRLASGAADTDESDAPLIPVATGIIAILMEGHLGTTHPDAKEWRRKFENMKLKHMSAKTDKGGGMNLLAPPFARAAMRVR